MITRYFAFGQDHMTSYPLPGPGVLPDFWVAVSLPPDHPVPHRTVFIEHFTSVYCPRPTQFAFEYGADRWDYSFFPGGELCHINEDGIQ